MAGAKLDMIFDSIFLMRWGIASEILGDSYHVAKSLTVASFCFLSYFTVFVKKQVIVLHKEWKCLSFIVYYFFLHIVNTCNLSYMICMHMYETCSICSTWPQIQKKIGLFRHPYLKRLKDLITCLKVSITLEKDPNPHPLISYRISSEALGQPYDCPHTRKAILKTMVKNDHYQTTTKYYKVCTVLLFWTLCKCIHKYTS